MQNERPRFIEEIFETITYDLSAKHLDQLPLEEINIPVRTYNTLKRKSINTIGELAAFLKQGSFAILGTRGFWREIILDELVNCLSDYGYPMRVFPPDILKYL